MLEKYTVSLLSHAASCGLHLCVPAALASCTLTQTVTGSERWCWRCLLDTHTYACTHSHTLSPHHSWTWGHAGIVIRVGMTLFAVYSSCGIAARWLWELLCLLCARSQTRVHTNKYTADLDRCQDGIQPLSSSHTCIEMCAHSVWAHA